MASSEVEKLPQAPPVFTHSPTLIVDDAKCTIRQFYDLQNRIAKNVVPDRATFANVVLPLGQAENVLASKAQLLTFYKVVSPDPQLRDASITAQTLFDEFAIETKMREDIFQLVDAVRKKGEDLDQESHQLLTKMHKDFIANGLNLSTDPLRDRFKAIKKRLSQVTNKFRENLVEENGCIWLLPQELIGVPETVVTRLQKGGNENLGKLRLTFKYPDLYPALRYATSGETRKRIYVANDNKCPENVPLFKEVVVLRDEAARLLGYPHHAAFRLEDKMARSSNVVDSFLNNLRLKLSVGGIKEINHMKELKKADLSFQGQAFNGRLYLWDQGFYNRLMLETRHSVDHLKIAEYFPLQNTISGEEKDVWHGDVRVFSVWEGAKQDYDFLGYLYLDLFSRQGKYGNASNFNLQPGFTQADGTRFYPATALVCNFSQPSLTEPSLLKHDEVVTLFHELGHGIHNLVSKTKYSRFHGTNTVIDFGEIPSQMLENWCWMPCQLKALSRHYSSICPEYFQLWKEQSGKSFAPSQEVSEEIICNLIAAKNVNRALFNLRQLHLGIFDMMIHEPGSHEAAKNMNISALYNLLRKDILRMDGPEVLDQGNEWGHGQANFGHLMGDYDAGYYCYLSGQVYSADLFYTVFKEDPMSAREGHRYRHAVLEKGGSQDEMKTLTDFLGREPSSEAFYKELGLA